MARRKFRAVYRIKAGEYKYYNPTRKQAITADSVDKAVLLARMMLSKPDNNWSSYYLDKVVELVTVYTKPKEE